MMCGIAGIIYFDNITPKPEIIKRMTDVMAHRGPDDEGIYISGPVGLGHRRLAIIDLSPAGKQPMCNEDATIWITYNGEIYNFIDIRKELLKQGHIFRSATDTEVIIHAYEEWGIDCLKYFNGMFAFVLWDERKRHLWLVRDRIGVKPLFYCKLPQCLIFGSEIKSILCYSEVPRTIDYEALSYYLALNYTPAPFTLFEHVRQLLPGHYLMVNTEGHIKDIEYWNLVYHEDETGNEKSYLDDFNALLEDSVRLRLISDVPFGAFLSGGIDSSSIVYWMSRNLNAPVKTFSIGFGEPSYDELEYARAVSQNIHTDHYEQIVTADTATILPKIVWHAEEPTADSSMVAVYYLSQLARKHVTMVLSGDGADELLAGYETYQAYYLLRLYRWLPAWLRQHVIMPLVKLLPVSDSKVSFDFKLRRFVTGAELMPEDAHATWRLIFDAETRAKLLLTALQHPGVNADVIDLYRAEFSKTNARNPLNRMLYVDTRFYLPNDMLVKIDRMSMAHSLEVREPYLDYRLVEFLASVPPRLKLKNFYQKKYLLKISMKEKLPNSILRRKKQGFNVPNARWIKNDMKPFVLDTLSNTRIKELEIFDCKVVENILKDHFEEKSDNSHQIWCLLTIVLWWDQFIRKNISFAY